MLTDTPDLHTIRCLLENFELRIVLDSPDNDYRLEYFTTAVKARQTGVPRLTRTYRLFDLVRGGNTPEPWDTYDIDKQATLVINLIRYGRYRMSKVVCGWEVTCSVCGHIMRGKTWKPAPKTCTAKSPRKCQTRIDDKSLTEVMFGAHCT